MKVFFCDGSTLNNGQFGKQISRVAVTTGTGELLVDHMIGDKTNIESEAFAILAALKRIRTQKIENAQIRTDSNFWAKASQFRWKLKKERLFPLRDKIYSLLDETGAEVVWVPREQNPAGHYLEKNPTRKMGQKKKTKTFNCPHCGKTIVWGYSQNET